MEGEAPDVPNDPYRLTGIRAKGGQAMLIDQGDLLWGMSMIFVKTFMDTAIKEAYLKGDLVFSEGDKADYFYTLVEGRVRLTINDNVQEENEVYIVSHAGEAFGWSSLVDRNYYSASAQCLEPTVLLKVDRRSLDELLQENPENGYIFYRKLAGMLGNRLVQCYKSLYRRKSPAETSTE
jgi:CRP-like cAMP-binding protein